MNESKSKIKSLDTISINDLLRAVIKYLYIVVAAVIVGGAIGLLLFLRESAKPLSETYNAQATLSVITTNTGDELIEDASDLERTVSDITSSQSLATNVTVLAQSNYVIDKVVEKANNSSEGYALVNAKALKGAISVTPIEKTMFLTVTINWHDKQQSVDLVNYLAEVLPGAMNDKLGLGSVLIVDYATDASVSYSSHNYTPAYITALIGLVVGVLTAFLLYFINLRVNTSDEIDEYLSLNTLAEIPYYRRRDGYKLLIDPDISSEYREANAVLASIVNYVCTKDKYKVIYITSAVSGEGKTTVSINLAVSLAEKNKKVLLIDCDIKRPIISELLETGEQNPSFENVVDGSAVYTDAVYRIVDKFDFIRSDYADLMPDSKKVKATLDALRERYDYILIDTPPIGLVADAFNLNSCVDGMIYIIRQDFANFSIIADSINSVRDAGANIIGAVLNARHMHSPSSYYSKSKYYNKYYSEYNGDGKKYGRKYGKYYGRGKYYRYGHKNPALETVDDIVAESVNKTEPINGPVATADIESSAKSAKAVIESVEEPVVMTDVKDSDDTANSTAAEKNDKLEREQIAKPKTKQKKKQKSETQTVQPIVTVPVEIVSSEELDEALHLSPLKTNSDSSESNEPKADSNKTEKD